jgi:hypothetical protein
MRSKRLIRRAHHDETLTSITLAITVRYPKRKQAPERARRCTVERNYTQRSANGTRRPFFKFLLVRSHDYAGLRRLLNLPKTMRQ